MLAVVVASSLSALVAYRLGLRHSNFSFGSARGGRGGCVDFHEAQSRLGETACVSGRVVRAFTSRAGNSFLDFCADYRDCPFAAVIFASDRNKFGDLDALAGRQVEIEGPITAYQGRAEIIIHGPQQVRVLP
jgi:hypothetical protein